MAIKPSIDSLFPIRSRGVPTAGSHDQYADGRAAKVWDLYIGSRSSRTEMYKDWFIRAFQDRGVKSVIDVACGTGIDSVMLLEEGFEVVSCDGSDKMLKIPLAERWRRRKEAAFDNWVIKEANWLTLDRDIVDDPEVVHKTYDAMICTGNSFAHVPNFEGDQQLQRRAIQQFYSLLKPGGTLFIDHRNYDAILDTGSAPPGANVYYQGKLVKNIECSSLYVNGAPALTSLDYELDIDNVDPKMLARLKIDPADKADWKFRLSCYPHRLKPFIDLLHSVFGKEAEHQIYADFKLVKDTEDIPAYYMHVITRPS